MQPSTINEMAGKSIIGYLLCLIIVQVSIRGLNLGYLSAKLPVFAK